MSEKRQLAAVVLLVLVLGFWFGAVGNADFYSSYSTGDFIRIGVGFVFAIATFPVSGDLKRDDEESEDFEDD